MAVKGALRFLRSFLFNLLMNHWGGVVSAVLLVLHYMVGLPMWYFWVALGGWLFIILVMTLFLHWVGRQPDAPEKPKENKNPYSQKGYKTINMHR